MIYLEDWTDWDRAMHALAVETGAVPPGGTYLSEKATYWSNNPKGNALSAMIESLVALGLLERRDEPDVQFRSVKRLSKLSKLTELEEAAAAILPDTLVSQYLTEEEAASWDGLSYQSYIHGLDPEHRLHRLELWQRAAARSRGSVDS